MPRELSISSPNAVLIRVAVAAACMLITALYLTEASRAEEVPPRTPLATLSMEIDGLMGRRDADFTPEVLDQLRVDDYIVRTYSARGSLPVGLYVGYHASQRQGDTIHSPLNCLPGAGWQPLEIGRISVPVRATPESAEAAPIEINRVIIAKGLDRQMVLYWYQSHRRVVASEYWGKVYTVLDSVRYHRTDAALVRVVVPIPDNVDVASVDRAATKFVQAIFPQLSRHLPS